MTRAVVTVNTEVERTRAMHWLSAAKLGFK